MNTTKYLNRISALLFLLSISFLANGQSNRWFGQGAIHVGTDAEVVFVGPALSLGVGRYLGKQWQATTSYSYFGARLSDPSEKLSTHTLLLMGAYRFQNPFDPEKGFYAGVGTGIQFRNQEPALIKKDSYWLAAVNLGYRFPFMLMKKKKSLGIDLMAMGPYSEKSDTGEYTEVITQLMLGLTLQF
jgi:hypothetical protein